MSVILKWLSEIMVSPVTAGLLATAIAALAGYCYWRMFKPDVQKIIDNLNAAISVLSPNKDADQFARQFNAFDQTISRNSLLAKPWREFKKTLFSSPPKDQVFSSREASFFFNDHTCINSQIDIGLYKAMPNYLTGTGILGTFLGLVAGIYLATISGLDNDAALQKLLSGASLAFLTSVAGISTSILFSWRIKKHLHVAQSLLNQWNILLDACTELVLVERLEEESLNEVKAQTVQLKTINTNLETTLPAAIAKAIHLNRELLAENIDAMQNTFLRAGENTVKTVNELKGAVEASFQSFRRAAQDISNAVEKFDTCVNRLSMSTTQTERLVAQTNTLVERFEPMIISAQEIGNNLQSATEKISDYSVLLQGVASEAVAETKDAIKQTQQPLEKLNSLAEMMAESSAHLESVTVSTQATWTDYQNRFTGIDQSLKEVFREINSGLNNYTQKVADFHRELDKHLGQSIRDLGEAVVTLNKVLK